MTSSAAASRVRKIGEIVVRERVLVGLLLLACAFFVYRWTVAFPLGRPSSTAPYGWYAGYDQSFYLREAHFLGHLQTIPREQFVFGAGYPLLAAPFARSDDLGWPFHDPFFPADLSVWLLTIATVFLLGRRLAGKWVGVAAALVSMFASPLINFVVVPWNTTAVLAALMLTLLVALAREMRWWHGFVIGAAVALAYSARYVDALWVLGAALAVLAARRAAVAGWPAFLAGAAGGALVAVPSLYLQWRAFGNPFVTTYTHRIGFGQFHVGDVWPHAVQLFVSPYFLTGSPAQSTLSEPLLSAMFLLVFVPVGLVQTVVRGGPTRRLLAGGLAATCLAGVLFYLSYFATGSFGLQTGATHYFKIWFPLWALSGTWGATVVFRWVARSRPWERLGSRLSSRARRVALAAAAVVVVGAVAAIVYVESSYRLTPSGPTLSGSDEVTLWGTHYTIDSYCRTRDGPPTAVTAALSGFIPLLRSHPHVLAGPGLFAGQPLTAVAEQFAAALRQNDCAPAQAARLERAIASAG